MKMRQEDEKEMKNELFSVFQGCLTVLLKTGTLLTPRV